MHARDGESARENGLSINVKMKMPLSRAAHQFLISPQAINVAFFPTFFINKKRWENKKTLKNAFFILK